MSLPRFTGNQEKNTAMPMILLQSQLSQANRWTHQGRFKFQCGQSTILGQISLGQVMAVQRFAFGPNYPQTNWSTDKGWFKNLMWVLHYVRLGQVKLRRALRSAIGPYYPQAIQSIDQGRFQNILLLQLRIMIYDLVDL